MNKKLPASILRVPRGGPQLSEANAEKIPRTGYSAAAHLCRRNVTSMCALKNAALTDATKMKRTDVDFLPTNSIVMES